MTLALLGAEVIGPPGLNHLLDGFAAANVVGEYFAREGGKFRVAGEAHGDQLAAGEFFDARLQIGGQKFFEAKALFQANHAILDF